MAQANWLLRLTLDLLSILVVFIPWIVLKSGTVEPYQRGFYCDDTSIKYPYHSSTITNTVVTSVTCLLPTFIFLVTELVTRYDSHKKGREQESYEFGRLNIPRVFITLYNLLAVYFFGYVLQQTITNIGKFTIGRLRPHYLSVCRPNYTAFNCTDEYGLLRYVTESDLCTGDDQYRIDQARLSFPSGHSSMSSYAATFTILYLQSRMTWRGSHLLRALIQSVLGYMALFTCLSRVSDYKHHWSDVLMGAVIGIFIAALMACHVAKFFKSNQFKSLLESLGHERAAANGTMSHPEVKNYSETDSVAVSVEPDGYQRNHDFAMSDTRGVYTPSHSNEAVPKRFSRSEYM